jgi:polyisoprenoid-binding protein YceI
MQKSVFKACAFGAAVIVSASIVSGAAHAELYVFDTRRTEVRFVYMMGFAKQQGRFSKVDGTVQFDERAPERSRVVATVATASLGTGEPIVDDELKGRDFFNVAAEPVMTFKSRAVRPTGENTAEMTGDITVNGITKPVTFAVSLHPHDDPALKYTIGAREFVAKGRLQRSAFNMTAYQTMVGDDIELEIRAIVRKKL